MDADRAIIARTYLWTEGNPADRAAGGGRPGRAGGPRRGGVRAVGTTGSARRLVGAMCGAAVVKNEITAHAVGTTYLHPDVRTILEIGGQDSKIICVEGGIAVDYAMNTLCAAGTGAFLSSQARGWAWRWRSSATSRSTSNKPANIAARCTVFAESDLVHKIQVGYAREDIIAGFCAVATNYLNNVGKGKKIAAPVVFQGGVSKNAGVVHAFGDSWGWTWRGPGRPPHGRVRRGAAGRRARGDPRRAGEPGGGGEAFDFEAVAHVRVQDPRDRVPEVREPLRDHLRLPRRRSSTPGATAATRAP